MYRRTEIIISLLFIFIGISFSQQKIGYVDSKIIIEGMQDAKDAQTVLDNLVTQWKLEISQLNDSLNLMKDDYEKKKRSFSLHGNLHQS